MIRSSTSKRKLNTVRIHNQLWLRWSKIEHLGDGKIKVKNPEFYGPVMSDCVEMEDTGSIRLDLTNHFLLILPKPYIVRLEWTGKISQNEKKAVFTEAILHDTDLGNLNLLRNKYQILIDCENHTTESRAKGNLKTSFTSTVYDHNGQPCDITN